MDNDQLRQITKEELDKILELHKLWLETRLSDEVEGECADLSNVYLRGANFSNMNLHGVDFSGANLNGANFECADLFGVDFIGADLSNANLRFANLGRASFSGAVLNNSNLSYANLHRADLRGADLNRANLDFSCFPLSYISLDVHIDDELAIQFLYHLIRNVQFSKNISGELKALLLQPQIVDKANEFYCATKCGIIK